jgi:hypothetical protein
LQSSAGDGRLELSDPVASVAEEVERSGEIGELVHVDVSIPRIRLVRRQLERRSETSPRCSGAIADESGLAR